MRPSVTTGSRCRRTWFTSQSGGASCSKPLALRRPALSPKWRSRPELGVAPPAATADGPLQRIAEKFRIALESPGALQVRGEARRPACLRIESLDARVALPLKCE